MAWAPRGLDRAAAARRKSALDPATEIRNAVHRPAGIEEPPGPGLELAILGLRAGPAQVWGWEAADSRSAASAGFGCSACGSGMGNARQPARKINIQARPVGGKRHSLGRHLGRVSPFHPVHGVEVGVGELTRQGVRVGVGVEVGGRAVLDGWGVGVIGVGVIRASAG